MVFHGLKRSSRFCHAVSRFFTLCVGPHDSSLNCYLIPYLSIGNLIPSVHWLPRQEGGVHYSHDRFHTLHVHVMWLIQTVEMKLADFNCLIHFQNVTHSQFKRTFVNFMNQFLTEGVHATWFSSDGLGQCGSRMIHAYSSRRKRYRRAKMINIYYFLTARSHFLHSKPIEKQGPSTLVMTTLPSLQPQKGQPQLFLTLKIIERSIKIMWKNANWRS